jgi:Zn ribbon nucleic-acid-binding protein
MKATFGCYRTTPTAAMKIESGLQPAWIRLQTKVLSAVTWMQSLLPNHPIWSWLTQAVQNARASAKHIPHCSNLENLAREFPSFITCTIERVNPFTKPPWAEHPAQRPINSPMQKKVTKQIQREQIKKLAKTTWDKTWSRANQSTTTHLRHISGKEGTKVGPELYKEIKGRATCALLAQLRTGHCGLNHYLWKFKKVESVECEMCGYEKETVEHFLVECPYFWEERHELRRKVGTRRMKMAVLLADKNTISATMEYISATGWFKQKVE